MARDEELLPAIMEMIKDMMNMSKDMFGMMKTTTDIITQQQEQLTYLQQKNFVTSKKKKQVVNRDDGHLLKCCHCGRKHLEMTCPLVNHTCFRCHQYGHFVDKCPVSAQGISGGAGSSSRILGHNRSEPERESDISKKDKLSKTSRHVWD